MEAAFRETSLQTEGPEDPDLELASDHC